jgi:hypothetical protein
MKRNFCTFIAEVFFPIILMVLIYGIRKAFKIKYHYFNDEEESDAKYLSKRAIAFTESIDSTIATELQKSPFLQLCYNNIKKEERPKIAVVKVPNEIKTKIQTLANLLDPTFPITSSTWKEFNSVEEMREYVKDGAYGSSNNPLLCFGISFSSSQNKKYDYGLHYFDSVMDEGILDIPDGRGDANDQFQDGPDMDSYDLYLDNGFNFIQKIITEYILDQESGSSNNKIEFGMIPQKYDFYRTDPFGAFVGYIIPFFCCYCLYVSSLFICFKNG